MLSHAGASPHWERMWSGGLGKGQAFDVGAPSAALAAELARMAPPAPGSTALVPGCGRAYDALALARFGFESVTAVDLAPTAIESAREELARASDKASAARVQLVCADFFEMAGDRFDFIWDCTFLCALDPSVRPRWAEQQKALLTPGGTCLTCIFPICEKVGGPPFAMSVPLVSGLLTPMGFKPVRTHECGEGEKHNPGGAGQLGGPGTTLVAWQL
jgi:SAM-dependent methyltransferase